MNEHTRRPIARWLEPNRPVGQESRKTFADKIASGFFDRYLSGERVLEIGYRGYLQEEVVPIVPQAIGIDRDFPGYDGVRLPFDDESVDAIYSSHCFEHIPDCVSAIQDWFRVLKVGGYIVLVVPHQYLFEKRANFPSFGNPDHYHFFTPGSLLSLVERAFDPNTYRVRELSDNDKGYDYNIGPMHPSSGCYEIELVIEKIKRPSWNLDNGTVRAYSAAELSTHEYRPNTWSIEFDFSNTDRFLSWGPWITLERGSYVAHFEFEAIGLDHAPLDGSFIFEVSKFGEAIHQVKCEGEAGRDILRQGHVAIPFTVPEKAIYYEFRTLSYGIPFAGKIALKGVILRHA